MIVVHARARSCMPGEQQLSYRCAQETHQPAADHCSLQRCVRAGQNDWRESKSVRLCRIGREAATLDNGLTLSWLTKLRPTQSSTLTCYDSVDFTEDVIRK